MVLEEVPAGQTPIGAGHLVEVVTHRLVDLVEGMHHAVAKPWLSFAGSHGAVLHRTHHTGTSGMYGLVRRGGSAVAAIADRLVVRDHVRVEAARAAVNAVWGDDPARPVRNDTTIRDSASSVVAPNTAELAAKFPDAKHRLIVLIHGLGQTERCWDNIEPSFDETFSTLRIRYNTGLPVSTSAAEVASLLDQTVEHWPVKVREVVLVGYSMGGLVARASVNKAHAEGHTWVAHARHVISLAAPLLGSPIEKGAEALARGLAIAPQTRPLADFVSSRSQGIKDLRHGSAVDDVLPGHVEHHCVAAVVTRDPNHAMGHLLGDLVVRTKSATGHGRQRSIEHSSVNVLGGRSHASVLDAPELAELFASLLIHAPGSTCQS